MSISAVSRTASSGISTAARPAWTASTGMDDSEIGHVELDRRAGAGRACDANLALEPFDGVAHHVQTHAAAREIRDTAARADATLEQQLDELALSERVRGVCGHEAPLRRRSLDSRLVDAPAVVAAGENSPMADAGDSERDAPGFGFSEHDAFRGILDAVRDAVADEMEQGASQRGKHVRVQPDLASAERDLDRGAEGAGGIASRAAQVGEHGFGRQQPEPENPLAKIVELAAELVTVARERCERV